MIQPPKRPPPPRIDCPHINILHAASRAHESLPHSASCNLFTENGDCRPSCRLSLLRRSNGSTFSHYTSSRRSSSAARSSFSSSIFSSGIVGHPVPLILL